MPAFLYELMRQGSNDSTPDDLARVFSQARGVDGPEARGVMYGVDGEDGVMYGVMDGEDREDGAMDGEDREDGVMYGVMDGEDREDGVMDGEDREDGVMYGVMDGEDREDGAMDGEDREDGVMYGVMDGEDGAMDGEDREDGVMYGVDGVDDTDMRRFYSHAGHQMEEMLLGCTWRGDPCTAANFTPTFTDAGSHMRNLTYLILLAMLITNKAIQNYYWFYWQSYIYIYMYQGKLAYVIQINLPVDSNFSISR